ncbi:hypothetical protein SLEP1_g58167 [Rubroshorea leprosula]|uniref:Disease resistance protein At4g27190-like leucine-rich repeats domain-containing protein n=1 Tax=Rubroshorea leprosula TaxID=152421 RepID=A0AAV5MT04_9ROSI|nr:hypothetical protein SLEP1_g58167 [Rubroshorea leprosula]
MQEIIASLDSDASSSDKFTFTFPKLRELRLWDLPQLKSICSAKGVMVCNSIETIEIGGCSGIRKLFPLELLQALQNLEVITVFSCHQMQEIIASLDSDASSSDKFTFTFPKLRELRLWDLPQLKSICSAKGVMVCNSIETIKIDGCPKLKRIPVQLP